MMTLLSTLIPESPPQVSRICGIEIIYESIKISDVPRVKSSINSHTNIFGAIYELGVLQNNRLKNGHTLGFPLLTLCAVELLHEIQ